MGATREQCDTREVGLSCGFEGEDRFFRIGEYDRYPAGTDMKLKPKISLKAMFALMTLAALVIYCVPIKCKATCDYLGVWYHSNSTTNNMVDIQGRNENRAFENVIVKIPLTHLERSKDPQKGRWEIEFRTNLYHYAKLRNYEILRFRDHQ